MMAAFWLLLMAGAAHGYGVAIARALRLPLPTRLERAVLTIGLGAALLVVATFALGVLHLLGPRSALLLILPAVGFGAWRVATSASATRVSSSRSWMHLGLLLALVVCVAANLVGTLAPPSFIDALFYHLFIARTYARAGGIVELPYIWQSYQPLGVEMLFTLGFCLHGAVLAALIHAGLGVLAACATYLLGRRTAGAVGGLFAAAIFYCTAMTAWESTSCFVELGIAAFGTIGFYAVLRWTDDEDPRWLVAAALLMGAAGTCKLTAIQLPLIAAGLTGWVSWRKRRGFSVIVRRVAVFMGISLAFCLPWYLHSYLWTENPVYPFAAGIFGDNPDYRDVWLILSHYGPGHGFRNLLLAPWHLLSNGAAFEAGQHLSPLPFVFAPLILVRLKSALDQQLLATAAAFIFLLWLASAHIARYLITVQPLLTVLAAEAACWFAATSRYRLRLVVLTGALFVGFGTVSTLLVFRTLAPVVFGRESVEAYLTRTAPFYVAYRMAMADVPENGLILTNQGATFYLDRPHVRVRDAEFFAGPQRISQLLAQRPFTHVLVHGQPGMEALVMALGPRVKLLWHRDVEMSVSRTLGITSRLPAALFEVIR